MGLYIDMNCLLFCLLAGGNPSFTVQGQDNVALIWFHPYDCWFYSCRFDRLVCTHSLYTKLKLNCIPTVDSGYTSYGGYIPNHHYIPENKCIYLWYIYIVYTRYIDALNCFFPSLLSLFHVYLSNLNCTEQSRRLSAGVDHHHTGLLVFTDTMSTQKPHFYGCIRHTLVCWTLH